MGQEADSQSAALKGPLSSAAAPCQNVKILYTKEFLLSFADLESCQIQPSGLDPQVLRNPPHGYVGEGVNASAFSSRGLIQRDKDGDRSVEVCEWRKPPGNLGGLLSQSTKRSEHGGSSFTNNFTSKSGPSRVETSHPRSIYDTSGWQGPAPGAAQGSWEHRPGSGDRERDHSHHDRDALEQDSGRRFHGSDHLTWQGGTPPEHDGLLGSGANLRSSRSSGGAMLLNARGHDRHHAIGRLHHASDIYQPLRSSKMGIRSRTEIRDIYNNETFGSDDVSNNERTEEERRRRDSFELMRKEQQKLLQEKQNLNLPKQGAPFGWELTVSSDKKKAEKCLVEDSEKLEDQPASLPLEVHSASSSSIKTTFPGVSTPASRPLVPPGFTKVFLEKQTSLKTGNREVMEAMISEKVKDHITKSDSSLEGKQHQMEERPLIASDLSMIKQEQQVSCQETSVAVDVAGNVKGFVGLDRADSSQSTGSLDTVSNSLKDDRIDSLPEIEHDGWNSGLDFLDMKRAGESESGSNTSKEGPELILGRLFRKTTSDFDKADIAIPDEHTEVIDGNNKMALKSSKFARWFHTEEEKPSGGMPVHYAPDLLSLFSKAEKNMLPSTPTEDRVLINETPNSPLSSIFPHRNTCNVLPMPDGPSLEDVEKVMTATVKPTIHDETSQFQLARKYKSDHFGQQLNVLTCEDLEQSIIAQASDCVSKVPNYSEENHTLLEGTPLANEQRFSMDDHASQHLLSLLQKGTNTKEQKSPTMQYHEERHIVPSKEAVHHENSGYAETPEKTGAQTLEFLFGKQFMKELRSADAPVSVKPPNLLKTLSNDSVVEDSGVETPFVKSLNRQNVISNAEFETHIGKLDAFSSLGKINLNDVKILGSQLQEVSFDDTGYVCDHDPWCGTANLNHGTQGIIDNSHFENARGIGNKNFARFGTGHKAIPNTVDKGGHSSSSNSDFGSDVLEASGFQERNSIMRGLFDPGSKKPVSDAGNMPTGQSFTGKNDSINSKLAHDGRSMILGRSSSNGSSASLPILDEFLRTNITGPQMSDNFIASDATRSTPDIIQKPAAFTDEKSRYEDHNKRGLGAIGQRYHDCDAPALDSRISLKDTVGASCPPFTNSANQSGGIVQENFQNNSGIHQLHGLPSHASHLAHQQLLGLADVPLTRSLSGPQARPLPAFFPYHHGPRPYDLNIGAINAMSNQQINHQQPQKGRQMKLFDHGSSLEPQNPAPDSWSEHLLGRPFSQEQSGQMLYPLHNGPLMNQSVYNSLRPHGFTPNHFMQPVPVPQRGLSTRSSFPYIPEQMPHAPRALPSNYPHHIAGPFTPDIPIHSVQAPPFHPHPSHMTFGTAHSQSLRPKIGTSPEFSVLVDGRQHAGVMGNDGSVLEMLFAKESKRQPGESLPVNQYPGRNMGYG